MTKPSHFRFPALTIFVGISGWAALFFSSHNRLISTGAAAVGAVMWTALVGVTSKIWARVEKTVVDLAGDALDIHIRDFASRYRKRYLQHLQHRHRSFDVKGLSTQGIYALEIEQVYVELTVDPTRADSASSNPVSKPNSGRHDIWTFLTSPQMRRQDFAVLGAPGSGKTTLLKHITLGLATHRSNFRSLKRLPVLLFIRDHAATVGSNGAQTLADVAEEAAIKMGIPAPAGWFGRELARGRCLVMLDGLDEVADATLRKKVAEWVETQMQAFGANRFLVTSRPFGYRSNPLNQVTVLEVRPFSADQGERFIANWYHANEVMSAQKDDEGVQITSREGAADLLKRLRANAALAELAVNPLLLTMIANVHRYRSSLPGRRVELYAEICEVFLGKRQQARGMEPDFTPAQKKRVLQPLAFHMMSSEKREIPLAEAVEAIMGPLALVNDKMSGQEFLRMVENASGLLLERENDIYSFAHLTFQEYLAASHIVEEKLEEELATRVAIPWWHEVIRLYVALSDATRIVEACIVGDESGVVKLTLAVECLEEARTVRPDLRAKVESTVIGSLEDPQPERARLAAETRLALRLRRLTRIDDDYYIDHGLISCAEYQLFIDDRRAARDHRQPDHWRDTHFPAGSAQQPALGVRSSDAKEFCRWLSERQGGDWIYQIPDRDLGDRPHVNAGYWAVTSSGSQLYGASTASLPLTLETLTNRFLKDHTAIRAVLSGNRDTAIAFAIACALDHVLDPARARDLALTRARDLDLTRASDLDLTRTPYLDLARALARALDRDLDLARDLALDRDRASVRDLASDLASPSNLVRVNNLDRILALSSDLVRASEVAGDLVFTSYSARAVSRLLLIRAHAQNVLTPKIRRPTSLLQRRYVPAPEHSTFFRTLLGIYVDLVTLEERIEGRIPAFEGIRITKVRKAAATKGANAATAVS